MRDDARGQLVMLARIAPIMAIAYLVMWLWLIDPGFPIPRDGTELVVGRDFLNFWIAGRHAWDSDPGQYYDLLTYQRAMAPLVGPGYPGQIWSYPPAVLLIAAPFGLLPYLPALAVWSMIGPIVFLLALSQWTREPLLLVAAVLCPAAVFGLISGQIHFIIAAILLTVLRQRQARPWLAGALLGLLIVKPQLGLFFPLLFLVERNFRAVLAAGLSMLAIAGLTALFWGPGIWHEYFTVGIPTQSLVLSDPGALSAPFMPTVLMNLRGASLSFAFASTAQALASVVAVALIAWRFRHRPAADDWQANAGFLAAAVLGTPYMLGYDTLALTTAALFALVQRAVNRWAVLGCWLLVLVQMVLGQIGLAGSALIPLFVALAFLGVFTRSTREGARQLDVG
ncbi:MAG: DUF2029 domain-containing protein [Pseudomonadota bacterium]|nr:DUF2029 domain-containing protein [Pseudomonadota bacterium]